jgi:hypothetical protein
MALLPTTPLTTPQLENFINTLLPDNITRDISEEYLRDVLIVLVRSLINAAEYSPSSSFAGLTGEVVDSAKLVAWGNALIAQIRGGVASDYDNLNKLATAINALAFSINGGTPSPSSGTTLRVRTGTKAQWTASNYQLASGEIGLEVDTNRVKFGIGSSLWNDLKYLDESIPKVWGGSALTKITEINTRVAPAAQWSFYNPVLGLGEQAQESDARKIKVGDGVTAYNDLEYWVKPGINGGTP